MQLTVFSILSDRFPGKRFQNSLFSLQKQITQKFSHVKVKKLIDIFIVRTVVSFKMHKPKQVRNVLFDEYEGVTLSAKYIYCKINNKLFIAK